MEGKVVSAVKLAPILEVRREREREREDAAWQQTNSQACRNDHDQAACARVKAFLMTFPNGVHAQAAMKMLDPSADPVQIAASPEDIAKAEASQKVAAEAAVQAKKAAAEACRKKCEALCKKDAACSTACAKEACQ
jgi:hypothetical protein